MLLLAFLLAVINDEKAYVVQNVLIKNRDVITHLITFRFD